MRWRICSRMLDHEIQMLGRWLSDTYKLYIEMDPALMLHISSSLYWAHSHSTSYVPPDLWGSQLIMAWVFPYGRSGTCYLDVIIGPKLPLSLDPHLKNSLFS